MFSFHYQSHREISKPLYGCRNEWNVTAEYGVENLDLVIEYSDTR